MIDKKNTVYFYTSNDTTIMLLSPAQCVTLKSPQAESASFAGECHLHDAAYVGECHQHGRGAYAGACHQHGQ